MPKTKKKTQVHKRSITTNDAVKKMMTHTWEPKLDSRFLCHMTGKDGNPVIPVFLIKEVTRPSISVKNNLQMWNPLQIKMYDPESPSAAKLLYDYAKAGMGEFDIIIDVLNPTGNSIEKWEIKNAKITDIDFGTLKWSSREPVEITATIKYSSATLLY